MKKVLVITDSLGLPRKTPETVRYEETWVHQLSRHFTVHQISIGGGTINDLFTQIEYAKMFEPDFTVIQSGIVDCAPRALTKLETTLLNKYYLTRKLLKTIMRPKVLNFLRRQRKKTYTSLSSFEKQVADFCIIFKGKLFWVGIVPAAAAYEQKVPGITTNVQRYNAAIKKHLGESFIDLDGLPETHVMTDHIHLSKEGHAHVYEKLIKVIPNI